MFAMCYISRKSNLYASIPSGRRVEWKASRTTYTQLTMSDSWTSTFPAYAPRKKILNAKKGNSKPKLFTKLKMRKANVPTSRAASGT